MSHKTDYKDLKKKLRQENIDQYHELQFTKRALKVAIDLMDEDVKKKYLKQLGVKE